jgi:hypothetical protein
MKKERKGEVRLRTKRLNEQTLNRLNRLHGSHHREVCKARTLKRTNAAMTAVLVLFPTTWMLHNDTAATSAAGE